MGRVFQATYTMLDPKTGRRVKGQTKNWYIEYTDRTGRRLRRKAGITKEQAKKALIHVESEILSAKNGLPTRHIGDIPCAELRERYLKSLVTRVTTPYFKRVSQYTNEVLNACRIFAVRDLRPEDIEAYLDGLTHERGLGAKAVNERLNAMKSMLSWSVQARLLPYNPLDCIRKRDEKSDRRHVRRALTEDEIARLLDAATYGPLRRAIRIRQNRPRKDGTFKPVRLLPATEQWCRNEGHRQALGYRLMLEAGLRKSETGSITWADVDLGIGSLTTRPWWTGNKNGKEETLPLTPGLLNELRTWRLSHPGAENDRIVPITSRFLGKFNDDLCAAGIARRVPMDKDGKPIPIGANNKPITKPMRWELIKKDSQGRVVDLHALRHTFATRLGQTPGIDPKSVQTLLRHSTPNLSFGVYVHSSRERLREVVYAMRPLGTTITSNLHAVAGV